MIRNYFDLLEQDEVWFTEDGTPIPLPDMDPDHRSNLIGFLIRNAFAYKMAYWWSIPLPRMNGEMAQLDTEQAWEEWSEEVLYKDPVEFIQGTALYKALEALEPSKGFA